MLLDAARRASCSSTCRSGCCPPWQTRQWSNRRSLILLKAAQGAGCAGHRLGAVSEGPGTHGRESQGRDRPCAGLREAGLLVLARCGDEGAPHPPSRSRAARWSIVAGIEAHVCVLQSCIDLATAGFGVFAVADAMSSRKQESAALALTACAQAGVSGGQHRNGGLRTAGPGRHGRVQGAVGTCHAKCRRRPVRSDELTNAAERCS